MRAPAGPPPPDAGLPDAPPPTAPPPKMKKKKKSKDSLKAEGIEKKKKKKKKKSRSSKRFAGAAATNPLTARARARLLCRAMELRISIARYYCQEAAYLDKVRGRATVNVGAFHETEDWRHGKKVLSALGAMAVPRRMPEELAHDLTLLRELEALLEDPLNTPDFLVGEDVPDDDLPELAVCLKEEIHQLRVSVDEARRQVAALEQRAAQPPPPPSRNVVPPPAPR